MDFLLKNEKIVIEIKKTRVGLTAKKLGEQLIVDIEKYQQHPDCKYLVSTFVAMLRDWSTKTQRGSNLMIASSYWSVAFSTGCNCVSSTLITEFLPMFWMTINRIRYLMTV